MKQPENDVLPAEDLEAPLPREERGGETPAVASPATGLPLSFAQQRLWILDQLEPGNPAYNVQVALSLSGNLDLSAFSRALSEIVSRHEILRTSFAVFAREPRQLIHPPRPVRPDPISLEELPELERESVALLHAAEEAQRAFDLTRDRLFRVVLLRLGPARHVFLLTMHHIVTDGWSTGVFFRELGALYECFVEGRPSPLPELAIQYADFAAWQREWLEGPTLDGLLGYWKDKLGGKLPVLDFRTAPAEPPAHGFRGARRPFQIPRETAERLKDLGLAEGATLYMTLLAAFAVLLTRYCRQEEIVVGTPTAGRAQIETEELIGFFINPLLLRLDLSGDPTFAELLSRVRDVSLEAYEHQDLPFEKLVEALAPERRPDRSPLFQVWFVLQNVPNANLELARLKVEPLEQDGGQVDRGPAGAARHDLRLGLLVTPEGLSGAFEYRTEVLEEATILSMIRSYEVLLRLIVRNFDVPLTALLSRLSACEEAEQRRLRAKELESAIGSLRSARRKGVATDPPH